MLNRRDFLNRTLRGSSLVALGGVVPQFLVSAAGVARPGRDNILVVLELTGGNDGLNTVIPFKDEEYARLRPTLKLPRNQLKKLTDEIALHPQMEGLAKLYEESALCVVQGVGYPNPSQSHFRSMDIWQAGSMAKELTEGWVGKGLRKLPGTLAFHLAEKNESAPLALSGAPSRVPSITSLEDFQLRMLAASGADKKAQRAIIEGTAKPGASVGKPSLLDFVQRTAANTYASSQRLQEIGKNYQPKVPYPNSPLANKLKLAAQLIDAELAIRAATQQLGGAGEDLGTRVLTLLASNLTQRLCPRAAVHDVCRERIRWAGGVGCDNHLASNIHIRCHVKRN